MPAADEVCPRPERVRTSRFRRRWAPCGECPACHRYIERMVAEALDLRLPDDLTRKDSR